MRHPLRTKLFGLPQNSTLTQLSNLSDTTGIDKKRLEELLHPLVRPLEHEVWLLSQALNRPEDEVRLVLGALDRSLQDRIAENAERIAAELMPRAISRAPSESPSPAFRTDLGTLFQADCMEVLKGIPSGSVDLVFADPPFNLKKVYESGIDDDLAEQDYLEWCERWVDECCRVLRPGGSFFLWNIPKWCTHLSRMLDPRLTFRHWIAVDVKYSLPISKRLYPSHYGLLYYVKGKAPSTFQPDRLPMPTCPTCGADLRDYGGYKAKMNPRGITLGDVWSDISPVRHSKYKKRKGANELPIRLLDRIIEMATVEGDLVFDPFGGAGTTYAVAEMKNRRWIGVEIGSVDQIIDRLNNLDEEKTRLSKIRSNYNRLFPSSAYALRKSKGLWTCDDFHPSEGATDDDLFR